MAKVMFVDEMISYIPGGKHNLPFIDEENPEIMYKSAAFRYVLAVSKELVGFIGLI